MPVRCSPSVIHMAAMLPRSASAGSEVRLSKVPTTTRLGTNAALDAGRNNANPPTTTIAKLATAATTLPIGRDTGAAVWVTGCMPVGVTPPLGVVNPSRSGSMSTALCHRSAGFFSRHFITSSVKTGGTLARCIDTTSGTSVTWAANTCCGVVPVKGGRPVSNS